MAVNSGYLDCPEFVAKPTVPYIVRGMRPPKEREIRTFLLRMNHYMDPVDRSRGPQAVRVRIGSPISGACWYAPTLRQAWETVLQAAINTRRQEDLIETVVQCWRRSRPRTRRAIEVWLDHEDGDAPPPWAAQLDALLKNLPSYQTTIHAMRGGWREQYLRDIQVRMGTRLSWKERIRRYISETENPS